MKKDHKPLIIYIITAVLFFSAYLSLVTGGKPSWILFAAIITLIAGFSFSEKGFLKKNLRTLVYSFEHLHWNLIFIVLCDVFLLVAVTFMVYRGGIYLDSMANSLQQNTNIMDVIRSQDPVMADHVLEGVMGLVKAVIIIGLLTIIASIILYSIMKGIIWEMSYSRKPDAKKILKFLLLNAMWLPGIVCVLVIFAIGFRQDYVSQLIIVPMFILFHMTVVLNGVFVHVGKIWKSLRKMFSVAFAKFRYFVIPYLAMGLLLVVFIKISVVLGFVNPYTQTGIMVGVIIPLLLAVSRIHIAQVIKENI